LSLLLSSHHLHNALPLRQSSYCPSASYHHLTGRLPRRLHLLPSYLQPSCRHDCRAGLLWIHCLFGLATNPSIGTAPYPSSEDIWHQSDSSFQRDEDFDELPFDDFIGINTHGARRTQDHLGCTPAQRGVLAQGLELTDVDMANASPAEAIQYTSVVGIMMGEAMASHWGQGGTYPGDMLRIHCDFIINSSRHYPGDTLWNLLQSILHFDHNVSSDHMLVTFSMYPSK